LLFLLYISVNPLSAAEKHLASGQVPAVVARGQVVPLGRVPGTATLRLALGLPLRDRAGLTNLLAALYNPASPEFHRYLTPAEFTARFGPTPADYAAVIAFARTNDLTVTATHGNRTLVDVTGKVADVERAFQVRLKRYRHPHASREFFAPDTEPLVDARVPLQSVSGLDNFSLPHPNLHLQPRVPAVNASPNGGSSPYGSYMGNDFRKAYVPDTALTGAGQNVGLLQFDGFYAADITNYANTIGLTSNVPQLVVVPVDGGVSTPTSNNVEVALDIEMVMSMAPGVSNIFVYEAPNPSPWVDLLNAMVTNTTVKQFSCSWGGGGSDPASEQVFQQMAAQGQSFFNASGDSDAFTGAVPFPSDSPNITQVGATTLGTDGSGNYISETVWNWGAVWTGTGYEYLGSSGGISLAVAIPSWQLGVDMTVNHGSVFQRSIPDVALTGDNVFVIYSNGVSGNVGGTSCAAPLWAGLAALINQQAGQLGQPSVGFLNPVLYALCRGTNYATTFHDITAGNNFNASSPTNFSAVPGYDLCTGWGTPGGTNLINALTTPDYLGILPATTFAITGAAGGPFNVTNLMLTLTNAGAATLGWSLGGTPFWLAAAPTSGTLVAHGTATVNLTFQNTVALTTGSYLAGVAITNQALSRVQMVAVSVTAGQSIVQNGGFETGDFTGWTLVGDSNANAVGTDYSFYQVIYDIVHSGNYGAYLGAVTVPATLSQTLVTTPGLRYLVSCWLDNPQAGIGEQFSVKWNGTNYVSFTNPPAFTWTNFQFVATATGTNTVLQFAARNDPNYFGFDDVSVTPVPAVTFASFFASTNAFQLAWNSLAGLSYQVQYKTNLAQAGWLNFSTVAATNTVTTFEDTNTLNASQRFYRLGLLP
jgi:subtilase family serine protease